MKNIIFTPKENDEILDAVTTLSHAIERIALELEDSNYIIKNLDETQDKLLWLMRLSETLTDSSKETF